VDDVTTPGDDGRLNLHDESGMTRRDLMKRGAVVGGTLLWVAPAIQTYGSKAFAQENGSPTCDACVAVTTGGPGGVQTVHIEFNATSACCECIDDFAGNDLAAVLHCADVGECVSGPVMTGPCPG
jgi:hypothetical protein